MTIVTDARHRVDKDYFTGPQDVSLMKFIDWDSHHPAEPAKMTVIQPAIDRKTFVPLFIRSQELKFLDLLYIRAPGITVDFIFDK